MSPSSVELNAVAGFIRQHTHDIRNHLNGLDLEAALLAETVTDSESAEGLARMRRQIHGLAEELRALSAKFSGDPANRAPIAARELFLIWQDQAALLGLDAVAWSTALGEEKVSVDVAAVSEVFKELLVNARQFTGPSGLAATAIRRGGRIAFELRETKAAPLDPSAWGAQPFVSTKRGGYGLGLWQAAQMVAASGGETTRTYLPPPDATLLTKLTFPLA